MKKLTISACMLMAASLSACGSNFEWFPKVADTTGPTVSWSINGGITKFTNSTTNLTLPKTVTLIGTDSASEPVSLYYTTNGSAPSISSNLYTQAISVTDPTWVLSFFGTDNAPTKNPSNAVTIKFK